MLTRRSLVTTLLAAPVIIRTPGLLMPIKVLKPELDEWTYLYKIGIYAYSNMGWMEWAPR